MVEHQDKMDKNVDSERLQTDSTAGSRPWLGMTGKLNDLQTARLNRLIEQGFGPVEPEDRY